MKERELHQLLDLVRLGALPPDRAVARLKHLPFEDLGFAKVDHHRSLRQGYAEVIFGKGKTPGQIAEIFRSMLRHIASRQNILIKRAISPIFKAGTRAHPPAKSIPTFHSLSRLPPIQPTPDITPTPHLS